VIVTSVMIGCTPRITKLRLSANCAPLLFTK
jgi:hypothetical protein